MSDPTQPPVPEPQVPEPQIPTPEEIPNPPAPDVVAPPVHDIPAESITEPVAAAGVFAADVPPPPAPGPIPVPPPPAPAPAVAASAPSQWPAGPAYPSSTPAPAPAATGQTSSNAIIALILAVGSWAICPLILAIVALVFANMASKEIAASGGQVQGGGLVTASKIVAWINIGLWAALAIIFVFVLIIAAIASGTS